MIARVLIAQDADHSSIPKKADRFLKTLTAIEELHSKTRPLLPNELIDPAVTQFLINRAERRITEMVRENLREEFPIPEMAEPEHDGPAGAEMTMHFVGSLRRDQRRYLHERHGVELHTAEKVRAEPLKMPAHQPRFLRARDLVAESGMDVAARELAIIRKRSPAQKAEEFAERKDAA